MNFRLLKSAISLAERYPRKYQPARYCNLIVTTTFTGVGSRTMIRIDKDRISLGKFLDDDFTSDLTGFILVECMRNYPDVWDALPRYPHLTEVLDCTSAEYNILDSLINPPITADIDVQTYLNSVLPSVILSQFYHRMNHRC